MELIVFASFIVAEVYTSVKSLNKKDLLVSTERLDGFHLDLLSKNIIKDESEILNSVKNFIIYQTRYQNIGRYCKKIFLMFLKRLLPFSVLIY